MTYRSYDLLNANLNRNPVKLNGGYHHKQFEKYQQNSVQGKSNVKVSDTSRQMNGLMATVTLTNQS